MSCQAMTRHWSRPQQSRGIESSPAQFIRAQQPSKLSPRRAPWPRLIACSELQSNKNYQRCGARGACLKEKNFSGAFFLCAARRCRVMGSVTKDLCHACAAPGTCDVSADQRNYRMRRMPERHSPRRRIQLSLLRCKPVRGLRISARKRMLCRSKTRTAFPAGLLARPAGTRNGKEKQY